MKSIKRSLQERIVFLRLKSGDSDAFAFFYDQYAVRIYRFVFIKVSDETVAEDLTQDVFLKFWQHLVDKKHVKSFQAFVFRIARNTVIDYYRQANRQVLPLDYVESSEEEPAIDTKLAIDKSLDVDNLLLHLKKLKPEYQEVLLLRYVEDMSIDDISQVIQKDKNNVRVTIYRALNKLKELIATKNQ